MTRQNCWEVQSCGREPGGAHAEEAGVCPAASDERLDGIHGGANGGRACWVVAGELGRTEAGCSCESPTDCYHCPFYRSVIEEESPNITMTHQIAALIRDEAT